MKVKIVTRFAPVTLEIKVKTTQSMKLQIIVSDADDTTRKFTNRYKTVNGEETFMVRMPLSPNVSLVTVYGEKTGRNSTEERRLDVSDFGNAAMKSFVSFAQKFSFNVGDLEPNTYASDDDRYFIRLSSVIKGKNGQVLTTPARIGAKSGVIECSKTAFDKMTVPMRFAILCHEFSHFYLNDKMTDEMEADLNGLLIYLGLGYPRIEAYQAFLETFKNSPSELNKRRYQVIDKFINDFESMNMVIK
jgi:hypothetical protein